MITVQVTDKMKEVARKIEARTIANLPKTKNYTGLESNNRYYIGALGELAFKIILDKHKKQYEYKPQQTGKSDMGDFMLHMKTGAWKWIDVKTGGGKHLDEMFVPLAQFNKKKYPAYIGCRLNDDVVEVWGWCLPEDLSESKKSRIRSMGRPYNELFSIERLFEQIT